MSILLTLAMPFMAASGPVDSAVQATQVPSALRAAFTVELQSPTARQTYAYDPRLDAGARWHQISATGTDAALDRIAADWAAEMAPDNRLFANNVRANLTKDVEIDDFGSAWRVRFDHAPVAGSVAASPTGAQTLTAEAWIEPEQGRMMRLDYRLQQPVRQSDGSELSAYTQSYQLKSEPAWGLSYIAAYDHSIAVTDGGERQEHAYRATIKRAAFFFATPASEDAYRAKMRTQLAAY